MNLAAETIVQDVGGWDDLLGNRVGTSKVSNFDATAPFVLLDDAREGKGAFLLRDPVANIVAYEYSDVLPALEAVLAATRAGYFVAGFLAYEAGATFEPRLAALPPKHISAPLIWFVTFAGCSRLDSVEAVLPAPSSCAGDLRLEWSEEEYTRAVEKVLAYIRAGDIYQANLTFPANISLPGDPLAQYATLRCNQMAGWGGVINTGDNLLLCCSPELFFALRGRELLVKPMKGTAPRGADVASDLASARMLYNSPKERAENLMIVDLLRNDLSKVSVPGSVKVPSLFSIETYPTVHQMTSTIRSRLKEHHNFLDVIKAAFPCGSVTGAPKIRAMEIIGDLESGPRAAYTGSMGVICPSGDAAFNVMIRTLNFRNGAHEGVLNVGSGIVSDSNARAEWQECMTKLAFATGRPQSISSLKCSSIGSAPRKWRSASDLMPEPNVSSR